MKTNLERLTDEQRRACFISAWNGGEGDIGALVRLASGSYAQVNAGVLRSLDGRKVAAALGVAGRPSELECGRRRNVYLDDESIERAKALGSGNISDGIRRALQVATDQSQPGTHQSAR